ncbi:MAG: toll/interleukin-1 receptor domain-containing protein [Gammaproteobacteria bacterium]
MARIFLSYRRDDSAGFAGRLADALEAEFGVGSVFRDVDDIQPGEDFAQAIQSQLREAGAVLVMMGPFWLKADADGRRRLDDPGDFVRQEIEAALDSGKPLIPLLVGGAKMPTADELPPSLAALARRQAVVLSDVSWRGDLVQLMASLRGLLPAEGGGRTDPRRRWMILGGAIAVVLLGIYAALRFIPDTSVPETSALPSVKQPAVDVTGRWAARVKYDWGDQHDEIFEFKYLDKALHGTATYLAGRLTIEQAKVEGNWVSFVTHSQQMLGSDSPWKEVTHRYTGQITPDGIRFTLEDSGGYTPHVPVEFVARREAVKQGDGKSGAAE